MTHNALYSTNNARYNENGVRTAVSAYWGRMAVPGTVKIILKVMFSTDNVVIVD